MVLDNLASTGQLYVPGRLLTGDEVPDHPALVQAKLTDRMTTATKDRIEPLRTAYRVAQRPANPGASRVMHAPLEPRANAEPPSPQGGSERISL